MIRRPVFAGLVVLALSGPRPAVAADSLHHFELTPFAGYRLGGSFEEAETGKSVALGDGGSYGLLVNIRDKANTQYEFGWSHQETSVNLRGATGEPGKLDLDIDYFQAGGTYLWEGDLARPYMVATIGAAHYRPGTGTGGSDTYFAFSIGGGWKLWPTRRFGLRLEGRFYGTLIDSDSKIFCSSAPDNSKCLIHTNADVLWQWEMIAGGTFRF